MLIIVTAVFVVWRRYRRNIKDLVCSTAKSLDLPFLADTVEADA